MQFRPLHPLFGVEVLDCDLCDVTADEGYPEIRALFEEHSLLLFRGQALTDAEHIALARLFGPIEDRTRGANGPDPRVSPVSNRDAQGGLPADPESHLLHLKANQLWHTDSTFLPVPALANLLLARVVPSIGGETEFVSTRAAWRDMPEGLRGAAEGAVFRHRYSHSRAKISPDLAEETLFTMWPDTAWQSRWRNPVTGTDSLYIASHVFAVAGMDDQVGSVLVEALMDFATRPERVYSHAWQAGDLIIWDERATLHRGRPWPYKEERTLSSLCVTARDCDGLESIRPYTCGH